MIYNHPNQLVIFLSIIINKICVSDFYDFGIVIKSLLGPYDNFPEALDFVARFDGSHR